MSPEPPSTRLPRPLLIALPTARERALLDLTSPREGVWYALCGFGPVAAAARTARLLVRTQPAAVLLAGVAGTYDEDRLPRGGVLRFDAVASHGVGALDASAPTGVLGSRELGFPQLAAAPDRAPASTTDGPGSENGPSEDGHPEAGPPVFDALALPASAPPHPVDLRAHHTTLVTACAAAGSPADAAARRRRFPGARGEDMEAFGVALACADAGVPLTVVRGISNAAGDRDPTRWRVPDAMAAVRRWIVARL